MKRQSTHRNMTIEQGESGGFFVEQINCFGAKTIQDAAQAIDRYLDGDNDPQCKLTKPANPNVDVKQAFPKGRWP